MPAAAAGAQANPYPSSIVIGGVLGLLQISDGYEAYQQELADWLAKLAETAEALSEYDLCIYNYDPGVQEALVWIYGDILDFCQDALRLYEKRNGARKTGVRILGHSTVEKFPDRFGHLVARLNRHMDLYRERASRCDSQLILKQYVRLVEMKSILQETQQEVHASRLENTMLHENSYDAIQAVSHRQQTMQRVQAEEQRTLGNIDSSMQAFTNKVDGQRDREEREAERLKRGWWKSGILTKLSEAD